MDLDRIREAADNTAATLNDARAYIIAKVYA